MKINFFKLAAAGNDFVAIDNRKKLINAANYETLAKKLCHRHYGIGADGLLLLEKSAKHNFKMKYFNSDGSHAAMCGNGGRAIAKFASEINAAKEDMVFDTDAGKVSANVRGDSVNLELYNPTDLDMELEVKAEDKTFSADFINTGVPHAVIFVKDIEKINVAKYGKIVRNAANFKPAGTNVNFVQVVDNKNILVRTYERGVEGETLACGTGVTAAACISGIKG
ncbi:MAG: diaminopimelate epimerase, partial [Elusimicrobia bacterium]|nr:diaminopimelate epimerase [Elusimicrobiota bacterium]